MTETLLKKVVAYYLTDDEVNKMNEYRGPIPASRIGVIAIRRLLDDIEKGKVDLLKESGVAVTNDK